LELFVKKGYHRVSIPQFVEASGVRTGAIYNLFGNKENLARTLQQQLRAFAELVYEVENAVVVDNSVLFEFLYSGYFVCCRVLPGRFVFFIQVMTTAKNGDVGACQFSYSLGRYVGHTN